MTKCKIDIEENSECTQCCKTCKDSCNKKCVFAKFHRECESQIRSIVDVGYSVPVLMGDVEELRKLGVKI